MILPRCLESVNVTVNSERITYKSVGELSGTVLRERVGVPLRVHRLSRISLVLQHIPTPASTEVAEKAQHDPQYFGMC